jgi:hopene-associated glycosyltransferase HpnB
VTLALGLIAVALWAYLLAARGGFWRTDQNDGQDLPAPSQWPAVTAVVPARNEADVIATCLGSLLAQDYPGRFEILLVDDDSDDGTGDVARGLAAGASPHRLQVFSGAPLPAGWTGKLWAVSQGVAAAGEAPKYLWLTDADISHAPDNLRRLAARAEAGGSVLTSLMAELHCRTPAERLLIPAFVFFFQMVYPPRWVNRPEHRVAGAAGGCMLADRAALARAGGIAAIRTAVIDDCSLAAIMKRQGPIWLGLTHRSQSIRPYETLGSIGRMVSRSAYAQLGYSPWQLVGALLGLAVTYLLPPALALFGHGAAQVCGVAAWALMALSFQPMLRFYRRSPAWGLALPLIATLYAIFTWQSAVQVWRGGGGQWKGRAQALARTA